MWSYIIGGSGIGLGALAALWFYAKAAKAEAEVQIWKNGATVLVEAREHAEQALELITADKIALIKQHEEALVRKEEQIAVHKKNENELRQIISSGGTKSLIDAANRIHRPIGG